MKQRFGKALTLGAVIVALVGCGSQPSQPATDDSGRDLTSMPQMPAELISADPEAADWLTEASRASLAYEQHAALLQAARVFLDNEQFQHAGVVLSKISANQLQPNDWLQLRLQRARFDVHIEDYEHALNELNGLEQRLVRRDDRNAVMTTRYQAFVGQGNHLAAARQLIDIGRYQDTSDHQAIWQHLSQVPATYWRNPERETDDTMRGWVNLFERLTIALDQQLSVSDELNAWLDGFPEHEGRDYVESFLAEQPWLSQSPQRLAILLPLSGQFASQGMAVRDGILAALTQERSEDVLFFDTQQANIPELLDTLQTEAVEVVIGPLDRQFIERMRAEQNTRRIGTPWLQLWLNQRPADDISTDDLFFALDVDTELDSAVTTLSHRGHRRLLVLGADNQRGRQLSEHLVNQWQRQHGEGSARVGTYRSSADMREAVEQSLHVQASERRLAAVRNVAGDRTINAEIRNRQDIDAIYLVGDATQARLVKPFIDMSLSAFSPRVPVYGNSTVRVEAQSRGQNDLAGIHFSEAPWLLPDPEQSAIKQQLSTVRSNWGPASQRLTAMGFDSMQLVPRLAMMRWLPGYDLPGLTGQLRIVDQIVTRELSWATFEANQITQMAPTNAQGQHQNRR